MKYHLSRQQGNKIENCENIHISSYRPANQFRPISFINKRRSLLQSQPDRSDQVVEVEIELKSFLGKQPGKY